MVYVLRLRGVAARGVRTGSRTPGERNVLLTLARMWRTAVTGEFVPKDAASTWAAAHLPGEPGDLLERAGRAYAGDPGDDGLGLAAGLAELVERLRLEVEGACGGCGSWARPHAGGQAPRMAPAIVSASTW
jgi:hypothetical protein